MRIYLALALLVATLVGSGVAVKAHAYTCTTSCLGGSCWTHCY